MKVLLVATYGVILLMILLISSYDTIKGSLAQKQITGTKFSKRLCQNGQFVLAGHFSKSPVNEIVCLFGDGFVRIFNRGTRDSAPYSRIVWEGKTPLCKYDEKAKVFVSDINGDGFDDLLCQRSSGHIELMFSQNGVFKNALDWSGKLSKCKKVIAIADMTSDGKTDLICGEKEDSSTIQIFSNLIKS